MRWAWKLTCKKILKLKTTHVQTHARDPVMIVGSIEKHQTAQDWDGARRSRRRTHGDGEYERVVAAGNDESVEEK
jgi:hypothetical protein